MTEFVIDVVVRTNKAESGAKRIDSLLKRLETASKRINSSLDRINKNAALQNLGNNASRAVDRFIDLTRRINQSANSVRNFSSRLVRSLNNFARALSGISRSGNVVRVLTQITTALSKLAKIKNVSRSITLLVNALNKLSKARNPARTINRIISALKRLSLENKARAAINRLANALERLNINARKAALSILLLIRALRRLAGAGAGAGRIRIIIDDIGDSSRRAAGSTSLLGAAITSLFAFSGISRLVEVIDSYTQMQNRLRPLTTSTENLARVTDELFNSAQRTGASLKATNELYARLETSTRGLGLSQGDLLRLIDTTNKAVAISGATAIESANAIRQFSQGLASGALRGEELTSVLEQLPVLADIIATELSSDRFDFGNVARGNLKKLAEEGLITTEIIVSALQNAEEDIGGLFSEANFTIGQAFQTLKNGFLKFFGQLNESIGLSQVLVDSIIKLGLNFDTFGRSVIAVGLFLSGVFVKKGIVLAIAGITALGVAILANPIGAIATGIFAVIAALTAFGDTMLIGVDSVTTFADFSVEAFNLIRDVISKLTDDAPQIVLVIGAAFSALSDNINFTFIGILEVVARTIDGVIGIVSGLSSAFKLILANIPIEFIKIFNEVIEASARFVNSVISNINTVSSKIGLPILEEIKALRIPLSEEADKLGDTITDGIFKSISEQTAVQDALFKVIEKAQERAKLRPQIGELNDANNEARRSFKALESATDDSSDAALDFVKALVKESAQIGKTSVEIRKMQAAELGLLSTTEKLIDSNAQRTKLFAEREEQLRRVAQVTLSVATAEEQLADSRAEIIGLSQIEGGLSDETTARALQRLQSEFEATERGAESTFGSIKQFAKQAARNMQNAFADFFFDPFEGGLKGMLKSFTNILKRMVAEIAASGLLSGLSSLAKGGTFSAGIGALLATSGFAGAASAGGGVGGAELAATGLDIAGLFSTSSIGSFVSSLGEGIGLSALTSFGSGASGAASAGVFGPGGLPFLTGGEGALLGEVGAAGEFGAAATAGASTTSIASAIGPALAGIGIGAAGGGFIAGDKSFGKFSGQNAALTGAVAGAAIGSVVPVVGTLIGGIIGGVVGGLSAALFGRGPLKQKETNLIGDFGPEGFEGVTSVKFKAKGGAFRSSKVDRIITDTDSGELLSEFEDLTESGISGALGPAAEFARKQALAIGALLDSGVKSIASSLRDTADELGLGSSAIDNFSSHINIASKSGEALSEAQIDEAIADVADQMTRTLLPGIRTLGKNGETTFETIQRLGQELTVLTNAATITGLTLAEARIAVGGLSKEAFDMRADFIEAAGGIDKFSSDVNFFGENFLTVAERLAPKSEKLIEDLEGLGLSSDLTAVEFRDLVRSFGKVGGASEELFLGLLDLAPLFVEVKTTQAELNGTTEDLINSTNGLAISEQNIIDLRSQLVDVLAREESELQNTIQGFDNLASSLSSASDSLLLSNLSPLTPAEKLAESRGQFLSTRNEALVNRDQDALARLPEAGKNFLEASQIANASGAAFVADFNLVNDTLLAGADIAVSELDIAQSQLATLIQIRDAINPVEDEVTTAQAIITLAGAVLLGPGNPNVTDDAIRQAFSSGDFTPDQLLQGAIGANVSAAQIQGATDIDITDFATDPATIGRLTGQGGGFKDVNDSRIRPDSGARVGRSITDKGNSELIQEIRMLRKEVADLRADQNTQTEAIIATNVIAIRENSDAINSGAAEAVDTAAWRKNSEASIK